MTFGPWTMRGLMFTLGVVTVFEDCAQFPRY